MSKQTYYQVLGVVLTAIAYSSIHFGRSAWPYSKHSLTWMTEEFKGWIDFSFLLAYSFGIIIAGYLGDFLNIRYLYVFGLWGTCICYLLTGLVGFYDIENQWLLLVIFIFNGLFQSIGWPCCIAVIGNWVKKSNRGMVLGFWCINVNIGNMLGSAIGGFLIDHLKLNWGYVMLSVAALELFVSFLLLFLLEPYPERLGFAIQEFDSVQDFQKLEEDSKEITISDGGSKQKGMTDPLISSDNNSKDDSDSISNEEEKLKHSSKQALGVWGALLIPGVIGAGFSFAFLKTASYGELFWLPSYLKNEFDMGTEAAVIANIVEIGNIFGNVVIGYASDKMKARALLVPVFMWIVAIDFFLMSFLDGSDYYLWLVGMCIEGFFIGGPYMIISAAIASDLGKAEGLKNNKNAISTVAGIIDGFGSFMTALGMLVFPLFEGRLFLLFAGSSFLSGFFILQMACQDIKNLTKKSNEQKSITNETQHKEKITDKAKENVKDINQDVIKQENPVDV